MFDRLEKLIKILRKTGEKVIFSDSGNFDDFYVILALKDYEKLLGEPTKVTGLTGEELVDKINRDIALWKNQETEQEFDLNYNDFDLEAAEMAELADLSTEDTEMQDFLSSPQIEEDEEEFEEEERIEEIIDDGFDSIASILARRQQEIIEENLEQSDSEVKTETERNNSWSIPKDRQKKAEKVVDEGQYLEEITF